MTPLEKLLAIEEIRLLKARYMRFVDEKDWDGLRSLFTDDASFDPRNGVGEVAGPDAFVAAARAALEPAVTVHHLHCPEIEILSSTHAKAIWPMEDRLVWPATDGKPERKLHGMGHYREDYRKEEGGWKISRWAVTRLRMDISPAERAQD